MRNNLGKSIRTKRVYAPAEPGDGARVLVDRLGPRGLRESDAALTLWLKEIAPSTELRKWFNHDPPMGRVRPALSRRACAE